MSDTQPLCGSCRFWHMIPRGNGAPSNEGRCKRHAPRPVIHKKDGRPSEIIWPTMDIMGWCGEHETAGGLIPRVLTFPANSPSPSVPE